MAFDSGSFGGSEVLADIFDLLDGFMTANGWTIHSSTGATLHASNEECHVNLITQTATIMDDTTGPSGSSTAPDHWIIGKLGASDTPVAVGGAERVVSNDWTPPYANYWMFSGGEDDPPYVHLVVQKANGRFCHLSFGILDKKGVEYTGGAFLAGLYWNWGFAEPTFPTTGWSGDGSDISQSGHLWFGHANENINYASHNLFLGELDSNAVIANTSAVTYPHGKMVPLTGRRAGALSMAQLDSASARWLGHIPFLGPNPINGVTPLMEMPVMRFYTPNGRAQFLGTVPGQRLCSMLGRQEAEQVSFSTDEYLIFPFKRYLPWNPEPWADRLVTSGPYGWAFKKNV